MNINVDDNIRLELTSAKHAEALFTVIDHNRPHLSEFLPWVPFMKTSIDLKEYLLNCEALYLQKKEVSFVIFLKDLPVGRIGLHHINIANKSAAIGYWLSKNAEGHGVMYNSCVSMINYGFTDLGLNRIEIKAATKNLRSEAIPVKLGFKKEGILRQAELVNGQFFDLSLYAMLREEWANSDLK